MIRRSVRFQFVGCFLIASLPGGIAAAEFLQNPGFEEDFKAWDRQHTPAESGSLVTTTAARTAKKGLWIYTANGASIEAFSYVRQDLPAAPDEVVTAGAYIRTPGGMVDWVNGSHASVQVGFLSSSGGLLSPYYESPRLTTANTPYDSQYTVTTPPAPPGTAFVRYRAYLYEPAGDPRQSVANFDDCTLTKTAVTSPQLMVRPATLGFGSDRSALSFDISNAKVGTLSWSVTKSADWLGVNPSSGTTTTETDTVAVTVDRTGLGLPRYHDTITVSSNGGSKTVEVYLETAPTSAVPIGPSLVTTQGYRLMLRRRLPDGTLDSARPYTIRGVAWSPSSIGTSADVTNRRREFGTWHRTDIRLLKEMNANTIYVFLDFGTTPEFIGTARAILDYCYQNGIMVVMTVDEDGADNTANITAAVNAFKDHPAILMWALGNEWNLWRPDRPRYYAHYETLAAAATAMQANALQVKSLDPNHPVISILGEINQPDEASVRDIVNKACPTVDIWGANIYRGPRFGKLFAEWMAMSTKPLLLSEFGTDAFWSTSWLPVIGYEDQTSQASYLGSLWLDIADNLSDGSASGVCVGGTVFEWNDEWWKTSTGSPASHDPDGYPTTWNPKAHPDGFANEEWFGIVSVDRELRQGYFTMQKRYASFCSTCLPSRGGWRSILK